MAESQVTTVLTIANTRHGPAADPEWQPGDARDHDHLVDPKEARRYLASTGVCVPQEDPSDAQLARLRELREAARALAAEDPEVARARVERLLSHYTFRLSSDGGLHPVESGWVGLAAASLPGLIELLSTPDHVRTCGDPRCDWLFVDRSRNHSRQWCDMGTCGSRAKMTRYRQRQKLARS